MALKLAHAVQEHINNGEWKKSAIVETFAMSTPLIGAMPIQTIQGNAYGWTEEGSLPTAAYRAVNEDYTAAEAASQPRSVALKILGGTIRVDRAIIDTLGADKRSSQELKKTKALSQKAGYEIIHGDSTADSKAIDGLTVRFAIAGTRDTPNGGGALSMAKLDEAIDATSGATHLLMNRATRRAIRQYLRSSGTAVQMMKDDFGRPIEAYNDLPILVADPVDVDSAYQGLPFTEAATTCSLFVLSLGLESMHMVQSPAGLAVEDLGLQGTYYETICEWIANFADEHPRGVSRVSGILAGTAVA